MQTIRQGDAGAAVEDVQQRLVIVGLMPAEAVDGEFGSKTADDVRAFRSQVGLEDGDVVIAVAQDQVLRFAQKDVAVVRPLIEFDEEDLQDDAPVR